MSDDRDDKFEEDAARDSSDESTSEMEIIKGALGGGGPEESTGEQVFLQDLFAPPASEEPASEEHPAEPVKAEEPETATEPEKAEAPESGGAADAIKIVTDDDLRQLFEMSSPGYSPGEQEAEPGEDAAASEPKAEEPVPEPPSEPAPEPPRVAPEPEDAAAAKEQTVIPEEPQAGSDSFGEVPAEQQSISAEDVEEIGLEPEQPATAPEPSQQAEAEAPAEESPSLDDISPDEIVEQIETRAQVGEMTSVPTAKKGEALERTAEMLSDLEPAGGDMMSVDELKKLFHNVNILIEWAREAMERLDRLERMIEKMTGDRGGD